MVEKPTDLWRIAQLEYPRDFPTEGIDASEVILDKFVSDVKGLKAPDDYDKIVELYRQCILALNDVQEHWPFIDTLQREQLVADFFFPILAELGIPQDADTDLSLELRDW